MQYKFPLKFALAKYQREAAGDKVTEPIPALLRFCFHLPLPDPAATGRGEEGKPL